jgi:hypothetical protein
MLEPWTTEKAEAAFLARFKQLSLDASSS